MRARGVWVVCAVVVLARIPFLNAPLSPDEAGYLLIGGQWHAGTSLYGDYWVDRPPLLITLYRLAQEAGGAVPLRLLGTAAILATVLLAARLATVLAPPPGLTGRARGTNAPTYAAAAAALFAASPINGALEVDGEILALPFVLGGVLALVLAVRSRGAWQAWRWWVLVGVLGTAALLVKQSQVDVAVLAVVVLVVVHRRVGVALAGLALGGLGTLGVALGWAQLHGTDPSGLYAAVVTFRFQAADVISQYAATITTSRLTGLVEAFAVSGAPLVVLVFVLSLRRPRTMAPSSPDPRVLVLTLLAWECAAVAFGGSYWRHYLIGLVPGLVVAVVWVVLRVEAGSPVAVRTPARLTWLRGALVSGLALAVVGSGLGLEDAHAARVSPEAQISAYLDAHRSQGTTAVVAFGRSNMLYMADMTSPYEELWSLPVRVRDPALATLTSVLASPQRPQWVVVAGTSIYTWGITDDATAQAELDQRYHQVASFEGYLVLAADSPA